MRASKILIFLSTERICLISHRPSAGATLNLPIKRISLWYDLLRLSLLTKYLLCSQELFLRNNPFMSAFHNKLFFLRHSCCMLTSHTKPLSFMTNDCAVIHFLLKYASDIIMIPANHIRSICKFLRSRMLSSIILSWSFNPSLIQSTCHINQTHPGNSHIKYLSYNCCRLRINYQLMLILWVLHKAIRHMTAKVFPLLHLLVLCSFYFYRQVLTIIIVNDILHNNIKTAGSTFVISTVIMVIDGNEPHTHKRKDSFQVITQFDIISSKS